MKRRDPLVFRILGTLVLSAETKDSLSTWTRMLKGTIKSVEASVPTEQDTREAAQEHLRCLQNNCNVKYEPPYSSSAPLFSYDDIDPKARRAFSLFRTTRCVFRVATGRFSYQDYHMMRFLR